MVWHDDVKKRIEKGEPAQMEFEDRWRCSCGGRFKRISNKQEPDYICQDCQKRVEVKASTLRDDFTIAFSQIPLDNMEPSTVIAWRYETGKWHGVLRKDVVIYGGPFPPTHNGKYSTCWYAIDTMNFVSLERLGFIPNASESPDSDAIPF